MVKETAATADDSDAGFAPTGNGPYPASIQWTYRSRRHPAHQVTTTLGLTYELDGSAFSDDYSPGEMSAGELWDLFVRRYGKGNPKWGYGPGLVHIFWFVSGAGADQDGPFEAAPFQKYPPDSLWDGRGDNEHFLSHFTWPVHTVTGERVNFARLPVVNKAWTDEQADKGGFIQELLGWKPSPLQPTVDLHQLAAAAGLSHP